MKRNPVVTLLLLLALIVGVTSGCASRSLDDQQINQALDKRKYQITLETHDGYELAMTVFQPDLNAGDKAPLVILPHGFGLNRMDGKLDLYNLLFTGNVALEMWNRGYWVISYDQRGHGGTGDRIHVMHPQREGRDPSTIIDWVESSMPRVKRDAGGDLLIGMVGESYGGAVQLLASSQDQRIDAIIPVAAWHDMEQALAPNDVTKTGWIGVLNFLAEWWNWRKLSGPWREAFKQASQGYVDQTVRGNLLTEYTNPICQPEAGPNADALLIQGFRDVLFNGSHALANYKCIEQRGHDANVILVKHGHLLPMVQMSPFLPAWHVQKNVDCGGEKHHLVTLSADWLEARLGGDKKLPALPSICVTPGHWSADLVAWPDASEKIKLLPVQLSGSVWARYMKWTVAPGAWVKSLLPEAMLRKGYSHARNGGVRPAFIPLLTAETKQHRVGTPRLELQVSDLKNDKGVVFVALGIRKKGSARIKLVHQQLTAVRGNGEHHFELPPFALELSPGDQLGLLMHGRSAAQFRGVGESYGSKAQISGSIYMPHELEGGQQRPQMAQRRERQE